MCQIVSSSQFMYLKWNSLQSDTKKFQFFNPTVNVARTHCTDILFTPKNIFRAFSALVSQNFEAVLKKSKILSRTLKIQERVENSDSSNKSTKNLFSFVFKRFLYGFKVICIYRHDILPWNLPPTKSCSLRGIVLVGWVRTLPLSWCAAARFTVLEKSLRTARRSPNHR